MTEDKKRDIISTVKANWPWMPFYRDEHQISLLDYYLSSQISSKCLGAGYIRHVSADCHSVWIDEPQFAIFVPDCY